MAKSKPETETTESKGHKVILPNGEARVDFIRDRYYDPKTHKHDPETCMSRSAIKKELNEMLKEAGEPEVPYQIVFAATKKADVIDPRVAAAERKAEREKAKAAKEAEEADKKDKKDSK